MKMIDFIKDILKRPLRRIDRIQFAGVILLFAGFYFFSKYIKTGQPVESYIWKLSLCLGSLVAIVIIKHFGNLVVRLWLMISGTIGKIIFGLFLVLVYFVILVPGFTVAHLFSGKQKESNTNWAKKPTTTNDYQSMG